MHPGAYLIRDPLEKGASPLTKEETGVRVSSDSHFFLSSLELPSNSLMHGV
jgi:hypothetical protein